MLPRMNTFGKHFFDLSNFFKVSFIYCRHRVASFEPSPSMSCWRMCKSRKSLKLLMASYYSSANERARRHQWHICRQSRTRINNNNTDDDDKQKILWGGFTFQVVNLKGVSLIHTHSYILQDLYKFFLIWTNFENWTF